MTQPIKIRRSGNLIDIAFADGTPLDQDILSLFSRDLTYTHKERLYGKAAYNRFTGQHKSMQYTDVALYKRDKHGKVVCGFGFLPRVKAKLEAAGLPVSIEVLAPDWVKPDRYEHDWDLVMAHYCEGFRQKQEECLLQIASNDCGVINAPTGFGKGKMIELACLLHPKARTDIVVQGKDLVQKLASSLSKRIPSVGMVGAGCRQTGRVTVYSADSLHHSDGNADILLCDEGHRLAAPTYARELAKYRWSRNYMFSATPHGRFDGADLQLEGLFGPEIFYLSYQEAVKLGLVVQIRVEWLDVRLDRNPAEDKKDVWKERLGIWRNEARNKIIADKALQYDDDTQVLILVRTLEHALYLRKHLPGFALCHSENAIKPADLEGYRSKGLLGPDEGPITTKKREYLREEFEAGRLKKAIATGVWSTGVDFVNLQVLIRGDAMASEIADTQIPGRVCRINDVGKNVGILVDCVDQFDEGFRRKSRSRQKTYEGHGWEMVWPKLTKASA